jgi:hypothetical protein
MNFLGRIVDSLIEYEHVPSNVVQLNTPYVRAHAVANAAQAVMLDEEERKAIRKDEIAAELEELYAERQRIDVRIFDLENEQQRLRENKS